MRVKFQEILEGYSFADTGPEGSYRAILCRQTGKIYLEADHLDAEEFNEDLPEDIDDEEKYIDIPGKRELGLGKPLALDFAGEILPDDFDDVRYMFSRSGAYKKFRALLIRRDALDRWYEFEKKATERALREWCEVNSIEVEG
jgi:hypothetical protein